MNDCPNADVRDLLPDLVHGHLDATARRMVESHVAGCADCQAEVDVLRDMHAALRMRTPAVDMAGIVAAIPARRTAPVRRSWVGWRTAAAITMIAAGGSSVLIVRSKVPTVSDAVAVTSVPVTVTPEPTAPNVTPVPVAPAPASTPSAGMQPVAPVTAPPEAASPEVRGGRELAMAGGTMTDLNDKELATLLKDIEKMDAMPSADVETTSIAPISPRRPQQ